MPSFIVTYKTKNLIEWNYRKGERCAGGDRDFFRWSIPHFNTYMELNTYRVNEFYNKMDKCLSGLGKCKLTYDDDSCVVGYTFENVIPSTKTIIENPIDDVNLSLKKVTTEKSINKIHGYVEPINFVRYVRTNILFDYLKDNAKI